MQRAGGCEGLAADADICKHFAGSVVHPAAQSPSDMSSQETKGKNVVACSLQIQQCLPTVYAWTETYGMAVIKLPNVASSRKVHQCDDMAQGLGQTNRVMTVRGLQDNKTCWQMASCHKQPGL